MKKYLLLLLSVLVLSACGKEDDKLRVGSVVSTEGQITAYIVKGMLEHYTDEEVELIKNLGSAVVLHQAMLNGDANISAVRYTGTDLTGALGQEPVSDPEQALNMVQEIFQKEYQMTFFDSYGFNNTYAFMVTKETAEKFGLTKISDLKKVAQDLQLGVDTSWMNRDGDGYKAFSEAYDFKFGRVFPMQIGLVYDAVAQNEVDVVLGYTTDGRIASYDLTVLEDDLHFFPAYDASPFANTELLEKKPEVRKALQRLVGKISTEEMQRLNFLADNNLIEPAVIAEEFLKEHDYFSGDDTP
ncbi:Osmoprotectant-binding protein [Solibacillus isronensis B3W22]|uniref:Osmoprotectant-binding protein n=1 Tax=Solibacillus isronensis B3W22 TaxID=1224748 RepID=K1KKT5_9BACL|nr:osmoprotectant ABC transporter substrate-binding protein [Solibacillus isronensis]AMO85165.1 glycine/betaine ABC transporter substrate-binding protein [Solibacillus silvestris]EKB44735.1 Osmoprotectant-binding protein [Solibacillus isronensis B3W22]